ncbi:MAG: tetratricopeptide repeat protein, partial [bacterium]|nr:tetratricopeptide repeat protein [bacterium]
MSAAVFDPVDLYFVPVAGFGDIGRSGPNILLSSIRLAVTEPVPVTASYFQLLADVAHGAVQRKQGNLLQALRHYEAALATPCDLRELLTVNDLAGLYYGAGAAYYASGNLAGAISCWASGVANFPKESLMRYNLATALAEAGDPRAAAVQLILLLRQTPDNADAWYNLAAALRSLDRTADADAALGHELECLRSDGALWIWLTEGGN